MEKKTKEISVLIRVDLNDIITLDLEGFLDLIADDLIAEDAGHPCLMDISYSVEGHEGNTLQIRVTGYIEVEEDDWIDTEAEKLAEREEGEQILKDAQLERKSQ